VLRDRVIGRAARYTRPVAVLITCPSASLTDLPATLGAMRAGLVRLRRRVWWQAECSAGSMVIEVPLTRGGHRWHLHAHGVIDCAASAEWSKHAAAEWPQIVGVPGAVLGVEPLRSVDALAGYAAKVGRGQSWSPDPGSLPSWVRAHLDRAIRGRRLWIEWGGGAKGK